MSRIGIMTFDERESNWIYGLHDPGGEQIMADAGTPGWVVHTVAVGQDPHDLSGFDFSRSNPHSVGIICRINNGYHPAGTIPPSRYYKQFAQRCANFVAASPGCRIWIIGNEPNYAIERPYGAQARPSHIDIPGRPLVNTTGDHHKQGAFVFAFLAMVRRSIEFLFGKSATHTDRNAQLASDGTPPLRNRDPYFHGLQERFSAIYGTSAQDVEERTRRADAEDIWPEMYADCYRQCRSAIRSVPGHEGDLVVTAAVAPWNDQTKYPGNPLGDWIQYFQDVLLQLSPGECDGIALHTYTHGPEPERISSNAKMNPPFQNRQYEFRTYRDFLDAVPEQLRDLPIFITETDQADVWRDRTSGWVESAYHEINRWNHMALTQKIACMALYRWSDADKWSIMGKPAVIQDFRNAMERRFARVAAAPPVSNWIRGQKVRTTSIVNLRRSAGYVGKNRSDIVAELAMNSKLEIAAAGYVVVDALNWWPVRVTSGAHSGKSGWIAEIDPYQNRLLDVDEDATPSPGGGATELKIGGLAHTTTIVRLRQTPGYANKGDDDVIKDVAPQITLRVEDGPKEKDQLAWWRVRTQHENAASNRVGWMAERAPDGTTLLLLGAAQPRPDRRTARYRPSDLTITVNYVRLRQQPGFMNKPPEDVISEIWPGRAVRIVDGSVETDDLVWWQVETNDPNDRILRGWMADEDPSGIPLLEAVEQAAKETFSAGDLIVVGESSVRVRKDPGHVNAAEGDVRGEFRRRTVLHVQGGGRTVDELTWWRVAGVAAFGEVRGWVAQNDPTGLTLVRTAPRLPGTMFPNSQTKTYMARPFDGVYGIGQLWGENEAFYRRFTYDGVALLGHNGIDFLTPMGTTVRATEAGTVATTGFEADGFGHFVLLNHDWGQSVYAHLSRIDVSSGQQVGRSAVLGATGTSGNSSGPHLHFAIRIRPFDRADGWGGFADPLPYLLPTDIIIPSYLYGSAEPEAEVTDEVHMSERLPPSGLGEEATGAERP